jgi:hypothetical protein
MKINDSWAIRNLLLGSVFGQRGLADDLCRIDLLRFQIAELVALRKTTLRKIISSEMSNFLTFPRNLPFEYCRMTKSPFGLLSSIIVCLSIAIV